MNKAAVLDLLGVVRLVGYALAIVAAVVAIGLYLASLLFPPLSFTAPLFAEPLAVGLAIAWVAGVSRFLVQRMRFRSPQE